MMFVGVLTAAAKAADAKKKTTKAKRGKVASKPVFYSVLEMSTFTLFFTMSSTVCCFVSQHVLLLPASRP